MRMRDGFGQQRDGGGEEAGKTVAVVNKEGKSGLMGDSRVM